MAAENTSVDIVASRFEDPPADETFALWTVPQLKTYLRAHGARLNGKRDQLLEVSNFHFVRTFLIFWTPLMDFLLSVLSSMQSQVLPQ